jgi:subfamily B ATP-binding cassette protein MsbA
MNGNAVRAGVRGDRAERTPAKVKATGETARRVDYSNAWRETRDLVWARRGRLAMGLLLMLVNRLSGLVLPATSKFLVDDVIGKQHHQLLVPLALAAGGATVVQAVTSFSLSQVLGVAAQRAITEMRREVAHHIARLPVRPPGSFAPHGGDRLGAQSPTAQLRSSGYLRARSRTLAGFVA